MGLENQQNINYIKTFLKQKKSLMKYYFKNKNYIKRKIGKIKLIISTREKGKNDKMKTNNRIIYKIRN